ncbi:MAG: hypothetical protein OXL37_00100 [Chloroflexota bacterium]|nr:hypothetical protein [Chloroflexota bacterium]MDE2959428.1 hypothetical protein [Chloroflexota bacterium]
MAATLRFEHDVVGNIMYIEKCPPYPGQDEDDIEDGVIARRHPDTDEVESMMILFYSSRIVSREPLRLDIPVTKGAINDQTAAAEFDCLVHPDSEWLTFPADAEIVELYIPGWTETTEPSLT